MKQPDLASGSHRPWLALYPSGVPAELSPSCTSALQYFIHARDKGGDRVAVWYFDTPLTFGMLDEHARSLARAFKAHNVAAGDRVAVLNQNTPATVIALLAAWRLGASIVPMNPMLTAREVARQLDDAGAVVLIAAAECAKAVPPLSSSSPLRAVFVTYAHDFLAQDVEPELLNGAVRDSELPVGWRALREVVQAERGAAKSNEPAISVQPNAAAFITYTSGTTGQPKGAINTHANVAFSAAIWKMWLQLDHRDVLLAAAPFSHITGLVAHVATAFAAGAALVLCYRFEAATVLQLIEKHGCTSTVAAITAFTALLNHPSFAAERLTTFRKVYSGGAPVAPATIARWEQATGVYIHNAYGLTETTSPSHLTPLGQRAPLDESTGALSVGVPVSSTDCRVVSVETGEEVGIGEIGELQTRGPQVIPGYWRQPDETAQAFADDVWLHTGDLCRRDAQGWFYIVDRVKDVIVASGFKVWPREVEDVLVSHPAVSEAAVVGVVDEYRGESPKAFIALRPGSQVTTAELQTFCRTSLAAYKVPREIEIVAALPKTASGKILRRELRPGRAT